MIEWESGRRANWEHGRWNSESAFLDSILERITTLVPQNIAVPDYGKRVVTYVAKITGAKVIKEPEYDGPEILV